MTCCKILDLRAMCRVPRPEQMFVAPNVFEHPSVSGFQ
jgi:hypothetical protein